MNAFSTYLIAAGASVATLVINYFISRLTHTGSVKRSDAETIFKASEEIRNDMAAELMACRKDRDHYIEKYNACMEARNV